MSYQPPRELVQEPAIEGWDRRLKWSYIRTCIISIYLKEIHPVVLALHRSHKKLPIPKEPWRWLCSYGIGRRWILSHLLLTHPHAHPHTHTYTYMRAHTNISAVGWSQCQSAWFSSFSLVPPYLTLYNYSGRDPLQPLLSWIPGDTSLHTLRDTPVLIFATPGSERLSCRIPMIAALSQSLSH